MPDFTLTYRSGSTANSGTVGLAWQPADYVRLQGVRNIYQQLTEVWVTDGRGSVLRFYKSGAAWVYKADPSGPARDIGVKLDVPTNPTLDITLTSRSTGQKYTFYNFDTQSHEGMPEKWQDASGNLISYTIGGGNGRLITKIVDSLGRGLTSRTMPTAR